MRMRTYSEEVAPALLASDSGANYTQAWSEILADAERVVYMLIGHTDCDVAFNVQVAEDASGTNPSNIASVALDCDEADKIWTFEISANDLPADKQFVSASVTYSAGAYTLLRQKFSSRWPGEFEQDSTYNLSESRVVQP